MARYIFQGHFRDSQGNVVEGGTVTVYNAGTTTASTLYEVDSGGTSVNSVTSDSNGYFFFYIDTSDYPLMTEKFDITLTAEGYNTQSYEDVSIYSGGTFDAWDKDYGDLINAPDIDDLLPAQTTANKKVLKSDGTNASWTDSVDLVSVQTDALVLDLASSADGDTYYRASGTTARLAKGTARQGLQMNSGATAPEWADSPQSLMTEKGDILYASAANTLAALHHGTSGQFLQTKGDGANPEWANGSVPYGTANQHFMTNAAANATEWSVPYKLGTISRDMTAASGDVAYTGVGFKPSSIILIGMSSTNSSFFVGLDDATNHFLTGIYGTTPDYYAGGTISMALIIDVSNQQVCLVKTMDSDGFTLTWTKTGSPTGTGTCYYIAFR